MVLENLKKKKQKTRDNMIRSKATWVGEDGKSTEYFCHLKSRSIFNKTIK